MGIWICYTEVSSEPFFEGYIVGNRKALEWVKSTTERYDSDSDMILQKSDDKIQMDDGEHYIIAIKLDRI